MSKVDCLYQECVEIWGSRGTYDKQFANEMLNASNALWHEAEALEETKSTSQSDEEAAEAYASEWWGHTDSSTTTREYLGIKNAFLAGLKRGREKLSK